MNKTLIEWTLNPDGTPGYTLNTKTGCLNHTPEGLCLGGLFPCYAFKLANGLLRSRYSANTNTVIQTTRVEDEWTIGDTMGKIASKDPFYPRYWPEKLEQPRKRKKPAGIFLDDMSDWMGSYWPEEWTEAELRTMRDCPQHRFYTLTKQPQNLPRWSPFPPNCYVGVTATNRMMFNKAAGNLAKIDAKVKYISFEPLLDSVDKDFAGASYLSMLFKEGWLDWLIIGACTGTMKDLLPLHHKTSLPMVRYGNKWVLSPPLGAVEEIVRAADKAGIPVFLKDNLKPIIPQPISIRFGSLDKGLRQEMPK